MKRILIFVVAALVVFSVFVLADDIGPTFQGGKLVFNTGVQVPHFYSSHSYIEQAFVATATVYDATCCDTLGKTLLNGFYTDNNFSPDESSFILASLNVESNATSVIGVSVEVPTAAKMPNGVSLSYDYPNKSGGAIYTVKSDNPPATLVLPFDSGTNGHSGYLYVTSNSTLSQWNEAKNSNLMFTFTITPVDYY